MFKIGEFSKLSHTSVRMLRHYDQLGLLVPEKVGFDSGYRYYSATQLQKVNKINKLKELGFSLALIKEMIENADTEQMTHYFMLRKSELQEELDKLERQHVLLESATAILREDASKMNYHVILKEIPAMNVVSIRKIIPKYEDEGGLWQEFYEQVMAYQPKIDFPPCHTQADIARAIYHDPEYKEHDIDIELQSNVNGTYESNGQLIFKSVPAQKVASVTFSGPYEQTSAVVEQAAKWIEDQGLQMNGVMFNIYRVSPAQDTNPENWVTEACFPVA